MTTVLLAMSICSFLLGATVILSQYKIENIFDFFIKVVGFFSLFTPVIYWLYLLNILK